MESNNDGYAHLAQLALDCIHREYPNKIAHVLDSAADARTPSQLTPAFYGCFDWHSAVHAHWLLVRLTSLYPESAYVPEAHEVLAQSFTSDNVAQELAYLSDRPAFERPYGLAWLLQLVAELHQSTGTESRTWHTLLEPLASHAVGVFATWLPKLAAPIREGTHSQTAFALALVRDWAVTVDAPDIRDLVDQRSRGFYGDDVDCPCGYEPSGHDFLSPCLAEADLMRRVLEQREFAAWFDRFLPAFDLDPVTAIDTTDGHLVHLDGLNLSRAWMLQGIAQTLGANHRRYDAIIANADTHAEAGLNAVLSPTYAGGHWLGSFAVYLVTERGLRC